MPKIFTTCLVTGQPIDTGIEIDEARSPAPAISSARYSVPIAATEHEWSKDNARVVDGDDAEILTGFGRRTEP